MNRTLIPRRTAAAALTAALLIPLSACAGGPDSAAEKGGGSRPKTELTVLAASSLTDAFGAVAAVYEKEHPGTKLKFSFAGSQELAAQVEQGAPADVLVTADTKTMDGVRDDTGKPVVIATNRLVIATAKGAPHRIERLEDLADPDLDVVLAAPEVPVGRYGKQVLDARRIDVKPVSLEPNVRAVLSKVELGEADAGLVYATDVETAAGKVGVVEIPDRQNAVASYPAATLEQSAHPAEAREFVDWLKSPEARKILRGAGFGQP